MQYEFRVKSLLIALLFITFILVASGQGNILFNYQFFDSDTIENQGSYGNPLLWIGGVRGKSPNQSYGTIVDPRVNDHFKTDNPVRLLANNLVNSGGFELALRLKMETPSNLRGDYCIFCLLAADKTLNKFNPCTDLDLGVRWKDHSLIFNLRNTASHRCDFIEFSYRIPPALIGKQLDVLFRYRDGIRELYINNKLNRRYQRPFSIVNAYDVSVWSPAQRFWIGPIRNSKDRSAIQLIQFTLLGLDANTTASATGSSSSENSKSDSTRTVNIPLESYVETRILSKKGKQKQKGPTRQRFDSKIPLTTGSTGSSQGTMDAIDEMFDPEEKMICNMGSDGNLILGFNWKKLGFAFTDVEKLKARLTLSCPEAIKGTHKFEGLHMPYSYQGLIYHYDIQKLNVCAKGKDLMSLKTTLIDGSSCKTSFTTSSAGKSSNPHISFISQSGSARSDDMNFTTVELGKYAKNGEVYIPLKTCYNNKYDAESLKIIEQTGIGVSLGNVTECQNVTGQSTQCCHLWSLETRNNFIARERILTSYAYLKFTLSTRYSEEIPIFMEITTRHFDTQQLRLRQTDKISKEKVKRSKLVIEPSETVVCLYNDPSRKVKYARRRNRQPIYYRIMLVPTRIVKEGRFSCFTPPQCYTNEVTLQISTLQVCLPHSKDLKPEECNRNTGTIYPIVDLSDPRKEIYKKEWEASRLKIYGKCQNIIEGDFVDILLHDPYSKMMHDGIFQITTNVIDSPFFQQQMGFSERSDNLQYFQTTSSPQNTWSSPNTIGGAIDPGWSFWAYDLARWTILFLAIGLFIWIAYRMCLWFYPPIEILQPVYATQSNLQLQPYHPLTPYDRYRKEL